MPIRVRVALPGELELNVLQKQLAYVEEQVVKSENDLENKTRVLMRIADQNLMDNEDEYLSRTYEIEEDHYHYMRSVFPRTYMYSFIITMYSFLETIILDYAEIIKNTEEQKLGLNDIRGNGFFDRAEKYYLCVLNFELFDNPENKKVLNELRIVRNIIAHSNGRIEGINGKDKKVLNEVLESDRGLKKNGNYLLIKINFIKDKYEAVNIFITSLISRYRRRISN